MCGNGVCEVGEDVATCLLDCGVAARSIPVLPATIGACLFEPYLQTGDCAALPGLIQIVSDDACYSSLSTSPSTLVNILDVEDARRH